MFVAFGGGANGKGTVINAVRDALGDYARAVAPESFVSDRAGGASAGGPREDLVRLRGARLLYVNEPDEGGELREGLVKTMTGDDTITARGVHAKNSIEMTPTWVIYMPTNHKPIIKGDDFGIWRRIHLLPFERNFKKDPHIKEDTGMKARIKQELAGVLALVVRAGLRYQRDGLPVPARVQAATDSYRCDMDLLAEWLDECCEINPGAETKMADLWDSWSTFAMRRGNLAYVKSATALGRRLESKFPSKKGTGGVRLRIGISVRSSDALF